MRVVLRLLAVAGLLLAGTAGATATDKVVSKAEALTAIATFQKDPTSPDGFAAASTIMAFAHNSRTVHLSLSTSVAPWLKDKNASDADTRTILLTAYVAGNVEAQLKSGRPVDDVYAGWEQMLVTYAQLLQINSAARIPEVDDLKKREADGTLRTYAAQVAGK